MSSTDQMSKVECHAQVSSWTKSFSSLVISPAHNGQEMYLAGAALVSLTAIFAAGLFPGWQVAGGRWLVAGGRLKIYMK